MMKRLLCLLLCLLTGVAAAETDLSALSTEALMEAYHAITRELGQRRVAEAAPLDVVQGTQAIVFRGLDWGSSAAQVQSAMKAEGFLAETHFTENPISLPSWAAKREERRYFAACGTRLYQYVTPASVRVAGYPVGMVEWYFHYSLVSGRIDASPDNAQLYLVSMELTSDDCFMAQADLANKLTSLYGTPMHQITESARYNSSRYGHHEQRWESTSWYGSNGAAVRLELSYKVLDKDQSIQDETLTLIYGLTDSTARLVEVENALEQEKLEAERQRIEENAHDVSGL